MNLQSAYRNAINKLMELQGWPLLVIRLILGTISIQTGFGRLAHMPILSTVLGALLILGLEIRIASFFLALAMTFTIATVHLGQFHDISEMIRLQEVDYLLFFGLFIFTGAGKFSIDRWWATRNT